ncbi:isochorismatase family protein [Streptomyces sp. NBC_01511]|uniref:isochorismatase family protein n=1 Tax=Streptomyces sp. NBC_01511 TaxID=2903889 RepID=UPI00386AB70E
MSDVAAVQALVVVDVQRAFFTGAEAAPGSREVREAVEGMVGRARERGVLVVHLQNDGDVGADDEVGTAGWELALPVVAGDREVVVRKEHDDGFAGTDLGGLLVAAGVKGIAVCGVMSEMCVSATARTALARGYRVVLPHDAHTTYDVPAAEGISDTVPAAMVSRVAEWALGDEVEIVARAVDVRFEERFAECFEGRFAGRE